MVSIYSFFFSLVLWIVAASAVISEDVPMAPAFICAAFGTALIIFVEREM